MAYKISEADNLVWGRNDDYNYTTYCIIKIIGLEAENEKFHADYKKEGIRDAKRKEFLCYYETVHLTLYNHFESLKIQ
jgi:hypothetical protein